MRLEIYWNWSSSQSQTSFRAVIFSIRGNDGDSFRVHTGEFLSINVSIISWCMGMVWLISLHPQSWANMDFTTSSSDLPLWLAWLAGCLRVAKHMQGWQHTDSWGSLKKPRRRVIRVDRQSLQSHTRRESLYWLKACVLLKILGKKCKLFHSGESVIIEQDD